MDPDFWHERWSRDEIGFHKPYFNPHLLAWAGRLDLQPGAHVLVPLCGKSHDLVWLVEQRYRVSGIEISARAVEDFFAEQGLPFDRSPIPGGWLYRCDGLEVHCGDFFELDFSELPRVDAVYDRAALVALPPAMRQAYARRLLDLLPEAAGLLTVTLDYPQAEMKGPPFAVSGEEVSALFAADCRIEELHAEDCLASEPRFVKKGLSRLVERVYLMHVKRRNRHEQMA